MSQPHKRYARGGQGRGRGQGKDKFNEYRQTLLSTREWHIWDTPSSESASTSSLFATSKCGLYEPRSQLTTLFEGTPCAECSQGNPN